jgi:branched-chain amino acid transport system ATP-binding protein
MVRGVDPSILVVSDVEAVYADVILALRGVSLEVPEGAVVALLGANGAGKTTLLRAVSGLMDVHGGRIRRGSITFAGQDAIKLGPVKTVRAGVAQVMEGRRIFAGLTVEENLRSGAFSRRDKKAVTEDLDRMLEMFPRLAERRKTAAGYLSGGEQQMIAIGRALMAAPKLLLLDEPSLGLAPRIVEQIRDVIVEINRSGTSVLLVEQNATMALSIAQRGYVLENGAIVKTGTGTELLADSDIQEFYLGTGETGRASFRGLKDKYRANRAGRAS